MGHYLNAKWKKVIVYSNNDELVNVREGKRIVYNFAVRLFHSFLYVCKFNRNIRKPSQKELKAQQKWLWNAKKFHVDKTHPVNVNRKLRLTHPRDAYTQEIVQGVWEAVKIM